MKKIQQNFVLKITELKKIQSHFLSILNLVMIPLIASLMGSLLKYSSKLCKTKRYSKIHEIDNGVGHLPPTRLLRWVHLLPLW